MIDVEADGSWSVVFLISGGEGIVFPLWEAVCSD